jgi:hypothetical protein
VRNGGKPKLVKEEALKHLLSPAPSSRKVGYRMDQKPQNTSCVPEEITDVPKELERGKQGGRVSAEGSYR